MNGVGAESVRADRDRPRPRTVIVVGADIVGLSTAWFLQEHGVEVTVLDASDAVSRGNAELVAPALVPLHEPAALRRGLRSSLFRSGWYGDPARGTAGGSDPAVWGFPARIAANRRWSSWTRAVEALHPYTSQCLETFDLLSAEGVTAAATETSVIAAFRTMRQAEGTLGVLDRMAEMGMPVTHTGLFGRALREHVPMASPALSVGVCLEGQRQLDAAEFVRALRRSVLARGAAVRVCDPLDVTVHDRGVRVPTSDGSDCRADAVAFTNEASRHLTDRCGIRMSVRGVAGCSFTVPVDRRVPGPLFLPELGVTCAPIPDGLHVATTGGFHDRERPNAETRARSVITALRPLLDGVRWHECGDITPRRHVLPPDGRPVIGPAVVPRVYVAGGLGMWEVAHGPVAGRLLAARIAAGDRPAATRSGARHAA